MTKVKAARATAIKNGKIQEKKVGKPIKIDGPSAEIRVDLGATLNMQNMEFLRIGVGLSLPCGASPAACEEAFKKAVKFVETKLDKLIASSRKSAGVGEIKDDEDLLS